MLCNCPNCQTTFEVSQTLSNAIVRCPRCQTLLRTFAGPAPSREKNAAPATPRSEAPKPGPRPRNSQGRVLIQLGSIVLILAGGGVGYYLLANGLPKPQEKVVVVDSNGRPVAPTPTPTPTLTPTTPATKLAPERQGGESATSSTFFGLEVPTPKKK